MIWNSSADPADPDFPPDQVSSTAARTLPSTRAGGQDDVSSNKLPQIGRIAHPLCSTSVAQVKVTPCAEFHSACFWMGKGRG